MEGGQVNLRVEENTKVIDLVSAETELKYEGYLKRQIAAVERMQKQSDCKIPEMFCYEGIPGLSREVIERLNQTRPETIGRARRIPGMTPAALAIIGSWLFGRTERCKTDGSSNRDMMTAGSGCNEHAGKTGAPSNPS